MVKNNFSLGVVMLKLIILLRKLSVWWEYKYENFGFYDMMILVIMDFRIIYLFIWIY